MPNQALAEKEGEGMAKMIYRKDTGEILGVHILGLHAADLIHEASNAVATKQRVQARTLSPCPGCTPRMWLPGALHAAPCSLWHPCKTGVQHWQSPLDRGSRAWRGCRVRTRGCACTAQDIKFNVHAHPTLSEVLDELFKGAHLEHAQPSKVGPPPWPGRASACYHPWGHQHIA